MHPDVFGFWFSRGPKRQLQILTGGLAVSNHLLVDRLITLNKCLLGPALFLMGGIRPFSLYDWWRRFRCVLLMLKEKFQIQVF